MSNDRIKNELSHKGGELRTRVLTAILERAPLDMLATLSNRSGECGPIAAGILEKRRESQ